MSDFRHPALKQLTDQQVRFAPPARRREQLGRAARLLGEIDPGRVYPYQFVCFRVTEYRTDAYPDLRISGDDLTASYTTAEFADAAVGNGKAVSVSGISVSGTDAGNYSVNTEAASVADITGATLTVVGITAENKVYDGTTAATLILEGATVDGVVSGDDVTVDASGVAGAFADAEVGTNKLVTVGGLTLIGADAGKYTLTQPTTTADITPAQ